MQNKKGQDISITTIILVVLGIAVLVLLIFGFTKGWGNIAPWLSGNNVDSIKTQCQASCALGSQYEFCSAKKTVNDGDSPKFESTCYELATSKTAPKDYSKYKFETCSAFPTC
jgi:hypothetical protein